ncbi:flavodoxin [Alteromonas sp. 5E99-2]|uniref:DnaT-like ssDNA-binding domain-containing protein n=1 Tax=Alteromonas sp. 5E99-2 TaxID=2817683 RepID=UPI001A990724|nr:DnaT-like ssDNA-binding domain-containing protein [Alteromonas sp. 5E99-2]MBO1256783.1 flavodoxin [Alteromonas sp. 5E99-2]
MNDLELDALNNPLSNDARVVYMLGLRPNFNKQSGYTSPLDYKALLNLVNGKEPKLTRGRQINALIKELISVNLVALLPNDDIQLSLNGKILLLPKCNEETSPKLKATKVLSNKTPIHRDWEPNKDTFIDICTLIGVIETEYSQEELGEFIAYWLGRTEVNHTEYQWTQKFAQQLKRNRTSVESNLSKQTGTQTHTNTVSSLEADDNAKRLVAKYKKTKNNK